MIQYQNLASSHLGKKSMATWNLHWVMFLLATFKPIVFPCTVRWSFTTVFGLLSYIDLPDSDVLSFAMTESYFCFCCHPSPGTAFKQPEAICWQWGVFQSFNIWLNVWILVLTVSYIRCFPWTGSFICSFSRNDLPNSHIWRIGVCMSVIFFTEILCSLK